MLYPTGMQNLDVETLRIVGYTKITNLTKFGYFKSYFYRSTILSFLYSPEYKVFEIDILHVCRIIHGLHSNTFFQFFFKLINIILIFLIWQEHWSSRAKNLHQRQYGARAPWSSFF
jgi:hypothetical protein